MYARKLKVEIIVGGERRLCPLEWLDSFFMRSFTGRSAFDEALPVAAGEIEVSFRVDLAALQTELEDWLTKKFGAGKPVKLRLTPGDK